MGKAHDYYVCIGRHRKRTPCMRKAISVSVIEQGVEDFYQGFQVPPERIRQIKDAVGADLVNEQAEAAVMARIAEKHLRDARTERQALLKARYAGAVPLDLLKSEMDRLVRAIAAADKEMTAATANVADLEQQLRRALTAAGNCAQSYRIAQPAARRLLNQGFFEKIYISQEGTVERADLTEPFAALLTGSKSANDQAATERADAAEEGETPPDTDPAVSAARAAWSRPGR
jgi:ribosomal protein L18